VRVVASPGPSRARGGSGAHGRPIHGDILLFEEIAGLVRIELWKQASAVVGARLAAPQPLVVVEEVGCEIIAEACGISAADIDKRHHQPSRVPVRCRSICGLSPEELFQGRSDPFLKVNSMLAESIC
jgi:hypothetical protein